MRLLVLIVLLVLLPLQSSWAAAASVCQHETDPEAAHFGHHQHEHRGSPADADDGDQGGASSASHADCGVCHGFGTPFVGSVDSLPAPRRGTVAFAPYESAVLDGFADTLLRPPLPLVS